MELNALSGHRQRLAREASVAAVAVKEASEEVVVCFLSLPPSRHTAGAAEISCQIGTSTAVAAVAVKEASEEVVAMCIYLIC